MKKFTEQIKTKVEKLEQSYSKKELKGIEHVVDDLIKDKWEISDNLNEINDLIDLIAEHEVCSIDIPHQEIDDHSTWLSKIKNNLEQIHLTKSNDLSPKDIKFLEEEKHKLMLERKRLERDQKYIFSMLAQAKVYLMDARDEACKEATNGQSINELSIKIADYFGEKISELTYYEIGKRKIVHFINETFSVNKIDAHKAFNILEKSEVIKFMIDPKTIPTYAAMGSYDQYMGEEYIPPMGNWHINA